MRRRPLISLNHGKLPASAGRPVTSCSGSGESGAALSPDLGLRPQALRQPPLSRLGWESGQRELGLGGRFGVQMGVRKIEVVWKSCQGIQGW